MNNSKHIRNIQSEQSYYAEIKRKNDFIRYLIEYSKDHSITEEFLETLLEDEYYKEKECQCW